MIQSFIHDKHERRTLLFSRVCGETRINVRREIFIHFIRKVETFAAKTPSLLFITNVENIFHVLTKEFSTEVYEFLTNLQLIKLNVLYVTGLMLLCVCKYISELLNFLTWRFRFAGNVLHAWWCFTGSIIRISIFLSVHACFLQSNSA